MKKILTTLSMALVAVAVLAQQPVITFEKTEHDFGKINEGDGRVSVQFQFTNEGMTPLVLSNVRASCGCTTPTWTKEPVEPGQTGSITVTYNPNGRPGRFQKTVTVTSNASEPTKKVYIKGEVIPKTAKPVNKFTVKVGDFGMKTKTLDLGTITKGETKSGELEYANLSKETHTIALEPVPAHEYFIYQISLDTVKPEQIGKFMLAIDTKAPKLYGPVEEYAYVVFDNAKLDKSETYKLVVKADVVEDFSDMTLEEKQQAPIIETKGDYYVGAIAAGKVQKCNLQLKNTGVKPLEVRRAYTTAENITVKSTPKAIKSGKKANITIEINTKGLEPASYTREVMIISNDFEHARKKVTIHFDVE